MKGGIILLFLEVRNCQTMRNVSAGGERNSCCSSTSPDICAYDLSQLHQNFKVTLATDRLTVATYFSYAFQCSPCQRLSQMLIVVNRCLSVVEAFVPQKGFALALSLIHI